jgi:hypothetical protein
MLDDMALLQEKGETVDHSEALQFLLSLDLSMKQIDDLW